MKTLKIFLSLCILFLVCCTEDDEKPILEERTKVTVDLTMNPDYSLSPLICVAYQYGTIVMPTGGWWNGETNLTGKLVKQLSTYSIVYCDYDTDGRIHEIEMVGRIYDDKGNFFSYTAELNIKIPTSGPMAGVFGIMRIDGGEGAFKDAAGSILIREGDGALNLNSGKGYLRGTGSIEDVNL